MFWIFFLLMFTHFRASTEYLCFLFFLLLTRLSIKRIFLQKLFTFYIFNKEQNKYMFIFSKILNKNILFLGLKFSYRFLLILIWFYNLIFVWNFIKYPKIFLNLFSPWLFNSYHKC